MRHSPHKRRFSFFFRHFDEIIVEFNLISFCICLFLITSSESYAFWMASYDMSFLGTTISITPTTLFHFMIILVLSDFTLLTFPLLFSVSVVSDIFSLTSIFDIVEDKGWSFSPYEMIPSAFAYSQVHYCLYHIILQIILLCIFFFFIITTIFDVKRINTIRQIFLHVLTVMSSLYFTSDLHLCT